MPRRCMYRLASITPQPKAFQTGFPPLLTVHIFSLLFSLGEHCIALCVHHDRPPLVHLHARHRPFTVRREEGKGGSPLQPSPFLPMTLIAWNVSFWSQVLAIVGMVTDVRQLNLPPGDTRPSCAGEPICSLDLHSPFRCAILGFHKLLASESVTVTIVTQ